MLSLPRGFLLSSSFPLAMNFSRRSPEEFPWKIFAGEDFQQLFVLAVLCHLHGSCSWFTDRKLSWKHKTLHDVIGKTPSDIFKERKLGHPILQLPKAPSTRIRRFLYPQIFYADTKISASKRSVYESYTTVHTYPIRIRTSQRISQISPGKRLVLILWRQRIQKYTDTSVHTYPDTQRIEKFPNILKNLCDEE